MSEKKGRGRPRAELSLDDIGEKVLAELNRRLDSASLANEIPGTQLMQIAQRYLAHLEAERKLKEEIVEEKLHPLEAVDNHGIPLELRYKILWEYLDEIETTWRDVSERVREMRVELGIEDEEATEDDGA